MALPTSKHRGGHPDSQSDHSPSSFFFVIGVHQFHQFESERKIGFTTSQATENNPLDPVGTIKSFQFRMFHKDAARRSCGEVSTVP